MIARVVGSLGIGVIGILAFPMASAAQNQMHPRWEVPGFDFRPNGGWRVKAQRVAERRRQLIAQRSFSVLNAPTGGAGANGTKVTGTLTVPALFFAYANTPSGDMRDTALYSSVLFGTSPAPGAAYTLRTYYDSMSNNQFHLAGKIMGWARLSGAEATYVGSNCSANPFGTPNCNGIWSDAAIVAMQGGFREALAIVDQSVNFGQFDNDGPDGNPNSGDDDGVVDMIMFAHATKEGACGGATNNHIWSHRFVLVDQTTNFRQDYPTNDAASSNSSGFPFIHISDYFATSALGGSMPGTSPCDETEIMPIGTAAHEFGHALGLPDLYDTCRSCAPTEGIGSFGLMGSGNFTGSWSPSRMEAWSLNELGWITIRNLPSSTPSAIYSLGPAPVSDTAFRIEVQGSNPRDEYFLIDNRQAVQADTSLIGFLCRRSHGSSPPPTCGGGLLIWHIDGAKVASSGFHSTNKVNADEPPPHGVRLMQADGLGQLDDPNATAPRRRGDAGDPYPGITGKTSLGPNTNPSPRKNHDGSFAGFAIDQITQVVPGGEMSFRLRFGGLTVVKGVDTAAVVRVDDVNYNVYRDMLDNGSTHTLDIVSPQTSADGRRRFAWLSWSDNGAQSHTITATNRDSTITADLDIDYKLIASATSGGTISSNPAVDLTGTFIDRLSAVQLTATPDPGQVFYGWTGDLQSANAVISVPMDRPYTVTANFAAQLTTSAVVAHLLGPTQPLTSAQVLYLDGQGNNNGSFDIGDFLAWVKQTGAPVSPALLGQVLSGGQR